MSGLLNTRRRIDEYHAMAITWKMAADGVRTVFKNQDNPFAQILIETYEGCAKEMEAKAQEGEIKLRDEMIDAQRSFGAISRFPV